MKKTMSRYQYPIYIMFHPIAGFDEMKYRKKASFRMSILIALLFVALNVISQQLQGLQFSMADRNKVDLIMAFTSRIVLLVLFVTANWSFCVLMDGKARFMEIWIFTLYSLVPYIILQYLVVFLSNILTREEGVFLTFLTGLGGLWSLILMISALMNFHEYQFSKAVMSLILTAIGMLLIVFLIFLVYSLYQQISETLITVFNEILFRIRLDS